MTPAGGLMITDIFDVGVKQSHSRFERGRQGSLARIPPSHTTRYILAHSTNGESFKGLKSTRDIDQSAIRTNMAQNVGASTRFLPG